MPGHSGASRLRVKWLKQVIVWWWSSLWVLLGRLHICVCRFKFLGWWLEILLLLDIALTALYRFQSLFELILRLLGFELEFLKHLLVLCHICLVYVVLIRCWDRELLAGCSRCKSISTEFLNRIDKSCVRSSLPRGRIMIKCSDYSMGAHFASDRRRCLLVSTGRNFSDFLDWRAWTSTCLFLIQWCQFCCLFDWHLLVMAAIFQSWVLVKTLLLDWRLLGHLRLGRSQVVWARSFGRVRLISDLLEHLVDFGLAVRLTATSRKAYKSLRLLALSRAEGLLRVLSNVLTWSTLRERLGCIW